MKFVVLGCVAVLGALAAAPVAHSQEYPARNVTFVISSTAGGSQDVIGRFLADRLSKLWKRSVIVENRPGAGGAIATNHVVTSKPDGYTFLFTSSNLTTGAAIDPNPSYDPLKDLKAVGMAALSDIVIVSGARIPIPTLAELAKQAKAQKIFYGTPGAGTGPTFSAELWSDVAKVKMTQVIYKGGAEVLVDLAGGRIDVYFSSISTILPSVQAKHVTPIAVAGKSRLKVLPDVPTVAEAGFPGSEFAVWWGAFVPADTPSDLVAKVNRDIATVMSTAEAAEFLEKQDAKFPGMTADDFKGYLSEHYTALKRIASENNMIVK